VTHVRLWSVIDKGRPDITLSHKSSRSPARYCNTVTDLESLAQLRTQLMT